MGLRTALGIKKRPIVPDSITSAFDGKIFDTDWTTKRISTWQKALLPYVNKKTDILEIGSYQGRSATTFLALLPLSTITCVDPFPSPLEETFDQNMKEFHSRLAKRKGASDDVLPNLIIEGKTFDVIYIDGDHSRSGTLRDSLASWVLLKKDGTIIWDDYQWQLSLRSADRPQHAIDWFLKHHAGEIDVIDVSYQVIARRRK